MNMTPMIDVVFLLIIFFLVASHLVKQEVQANVELPQAATGVEQRESKSPPVTINVVPEGDKYVIKLGADPVERDELSSRLAAHVKKKGRELEIRIRADQSTPYQVVEPIMVTCARLGVWNVKFAVVQPMTND
jgi:biopolymer transport protein ExbD